MNATSFESASAGACKMAVSRRVIRERAEKAFLAADEAHEAAFRSFGKDDPRTRAARDRRNKAGRAFDAAVEDAAYWAQVAATGRTFR